MWRHSIAMATGRRFRVCACALIRYCRDIIIIGTVVVTAALNAEKGLLHDEVILMHEKHVYEHLVFMHYVYIRYELQVFTRIYAKSTRLLRLTT